MLLSPRNDTLNSHAKKEREKKKEKGIICYMGLQIYGYLLDQIDIVAKIYDKIMLYFKKQAILSAMQRLINNNNNAWN